MYQHHEESLKILEDMFRGREEVIALVFGGSVAKGWRGRIRIWMPW